MRSPTLSQRANRFAPPIEIESHRGQVPERLAQNPQARICTPRFRQLAACNRNARIPFAGLGMRRD